MLRGSMATPAIEGVASEMLWVSWPPPSIEEVALESTRRSAASNEAGRADSKLGEARSKVFSGPPRVLLFPESWLDSEPEFGSFHGERNS